METVVKVLSGVIKGKLGVELLAATMIAAAIWGYTHAKKQTAFEMASEAKFDQHVAVQSTESKHITEALARLEHAVERVDNKVDRIVERHGR